MPWDVLCDRLEKNLNNQNRIPQSDKVILNITISILQNNDLRGSDEGAFSGERSAGVPQGRRNSDFSPTFLHVYSMWVVHVTTLL